MAVLLLTAFAAGADDRAEIEAERALAAVRERIAEIAAEQRGLQGERDESLAVLREADQAVAAAVQSLRTTEAALATREAESARLERERDALSLRLSSQREALAALVRSAYALGRHEQLKLLLAQDRIDDLARVLIYHRYVQNDRSARIRSLMDELGALAELGERLLAERTELAAARDAQQTHLADLELRRGERAGLLAAIEARQHEGQAALAALERDQRRLTALLERLRDVLADVPRTLEEGRPLHQRKGALPWPLTGPLLTGFGGRLADGRMARGWLIAGTPGAEVRAISHGRVAYADWMPTYGLILILDHGDGWMSLYANNDALLKSPGDWIGAGEPIASVGNSGGLPRPALYFELLRNGRPVDPRSWLRPR